MVELGWVDGKVLVSAVELLDETIDDVEGVSVTSSTAKLDIVVVVELLLGVGVSKKHSWVQ